MSIQIATLQKLAKRVAFASAKQKGTSTSTPVINLGHLVATDGRRMAILPLSEDLVPSDLVGSVRLDPSPDTGLSDVPGFYDWKRVIPKTGAGLLYSRKPLEDLLRAVARVSRESQRVLKQYSRRTQPLAVLVVSGNETWVEHPATKERWLLPGDPAHKELDGTQLGFDPEYLHQAVRAAQGSHVTIALNLEDSTRKAFVVQSPGDELLTVMMPVAISENWRSEHLPPAEPETSAKVGKSKKMPRTVAPVHEVIESTPAAPSEPSPPVSDGDALFLVQRRRGNRHWRTQGRVASLQEARSLCTEKANQTWRVLQGSDVVWSQEVA